MKKNITRLIANLPVQILLAMNREVGEDWRVQTLAGMSLTNQFDTSYAKAVTSLLSALVELPARAGIVTRL